ncbi:glucuronate isomerase [Pseudoxanthomonas wuyuanensis]|uniref:Uronate isomerase n=1 Tax=Pseudoxanthomonas wuyuanensis TaxID=1073196 RepID=A0A286D8P5_9GAMM|nr:glucuronate isomerase [Pseudoxanthomonas wuyuanensis]KAF1720284.1 glucuronate isomerase [Pseudoxanthomonas wuyuanensis]SOD55020.1 glucuronate isomerase [Pseudoxanthomonas wuyuanensis]
MNGHSTLALHEDRLFPPDALQRAIARRLYAQVANLPIVSPHGHTDPGWFAGNAPFANATELLLVPDHYVFRMLYSQGVALDALGIPRSDGTRAAVEPHAAWRLFAENFHLFRGTPSSLWLNHVFHDIFGLRVRLEAGSADHYYDRITGALQTPQFRPRALFERFNIEVIATTESPLDPLQQHAAIRDSGWSGRVITAYRPDPVVDPEHEQFPEALQRFGEITGEDVHTWPGYLRAHRRRRAFFASMGATSTDHGHPSAATADLSEAQARALFDKVVRGVATAADAELFRAQVLTEMAAMSLDDGLVMQLHPGCFRNHNLGLFERYGRDKGADIPLRTEYVHALKPLLDRFGNEPGFKLILFTLDESAYSRELAPLAGHYPSLFLGPAWWFHDAPEGMWRFREQTLASGGFYNTVGFNDDTRAFLSIPARHDVARRVDCAFLAKLVAEHRLDEDEATEVAMDLAYRLPKRAYKL